MDKQIETTVAFAEDQVDFRNLLEIEILAIGGGEVIVTTY